MASRQPKKRKGRNNAPPRERTVTTLTDGVDGPFSNSPPDDLPSGLMSPPFQPPIPPPPTPGIPQVPYPLAYNPAFPYSFSQMSLPSAPPYQPTHPSFFPSPPGSQQAAPPPPPQQPQIVLPPGQNDLEILERLKDTIKNNQHALYRPVPQPLALASVYLGPKFDSAPSIVPPHPEQIPIDAFPPGLTLSTNPPLNSVPELPSALNDSDQATPRAPHTSDLSPRKPVHHTSVTESPKPSVRVLSLGSAYRCVSDIYRSLGAAVSCGQATRQV